MFFLMYFIYLNFIRQDWDWNLPSFMNRAPSSSSAPSFIWKQEHLVEYCCLSHSLANQCITTSGFSYSMKLHIALQLVTCLCYFPLYYRLPAGITLFYILKNDEHSAFFTCSSLIHVWWLTCWNKVLFTLIYFSFTSPV